MKRLFLIAVFLLIPTIVFGATYYVDTDSVGGTASDSNNGTATNTPWLTISKANSTATAGDTVYLRAGTYSEYINPSNSGTSGNPITFQRYSSDAEYSVILSASYGAYWTTKDYITIDGIYFYNNTSRWTEIDDSDYIIFQNCKFYSPGDLYNGYGGMRFTDCTQVKILDNIFEDAGRGQFTYWPDSCETIWNADGSFAGTSCNAGAAPGDHIVLRTTDYVLVEGNDATSGNEIVINGDGNELDMAGNKLTTGDYYILKRLR